jgi:hypothetical protein
MSQYKKEERFFKNFLVSETNRIKTQLSSLNRQDQNVSLQKFQVLAKTENSAKIDHSNIQLDDVYTILNFILKHDLDYVGSTGKSVINLWPKTRSSKCNGSSERCRELGNTYLQQDKLSEAVAEYNEAVLWAEFNSEPYALALANRAMAWIKVQERTMQ